MQSFQFYSPTRVVFGKHVEDKAGEQIAALGAKKALIHYGGGSVVRSGLLDRVKKSLTDAGVGYVELGGVQPNPRLSLVHEARALCLAEGVDFILAVGGGSVIDSAKATALAVANPDEEVWDFFLRKADPKAHLPIGSILTIAAAGSEMSDSAVITNEEGKIKRGLNSEFNRPVFALMNPELLYTLPVYQIACGVTDILMHTFERYFSPVLGNEITDQFAEGLLRTVIHYGPIQVETPTDYDAASEIMWTGSLSHNHITGLGGAGDWSTHQLGHELSGMFDQAHGATLAAMWGFWARYVYQENPSRFARFAHNVWGIDCANLTDEAAAIAGIERTEAFFRSIGMPVGIKALIGRTVTDAELEELAEKCSFFRTRQIGSFRKLDRQAILEIYRSANQ